MSPDDELAARVRSLEAERLRPVPPRPNTTPRLAYAALAALTGLCDVLGEDDDEFEGSPE